MRTPTETVEYIKKRIIQTGMTQAEVLKQAGCSPTIFTMAKNRGGYLRIETIQALAEIIDSSISEILGLDDNDMPEDIREMEHMLKEIPEKDRKMIYMNIENYFRVALQDKKDTDRP